MTFKFVILWKYSSVTEHSKCYKNDKLFQIVPNHVMVLWNILSIPRIVWKMTNLGRYLEFIFITKELNLHYCCVEWSAST